jgi:hypothetical protein
MTSFLIAYPDIPASALTWKSQSSGSDITFSDDQPMESLFYGERHNYGFHSSTYTNLELIWDLGLGNSRTIDHFILCGIINLVQTPPVASAKMQGSTDGSTWVDQIGCSASFNAVTRSGPNNLDIVFTPAFNDTLAGTLAAYRYWRCRLATSGSSINMWFSKIYSGAFFDMGQEPDFFEWEVISDDVDTWRYPRGHVLMTKSTHARHRVTIEWDGVTDAKAAEFATTLLKNPLRHTVVLYTATYLDPLAGYRSLHCRIMADECSITQVKQDWNDITMVVEELV